MSTRGVEADTTPGSVMTEFGPIAAAEFPFKYFWSRTLLLSEYTWCTAAVTVFYSAGEECPRRSTHYLLREYSLLLRE